MTLAYLYEGDRCRFHQFAKSRRTVNVSVDFFGRRHVLGRDFATIVAIKYPPHGKVLDHVVELVLDPGSHEEEVARFEPVLLAVMNEHSPAANDEVNLVLCMRRLLFRNESEGKGYVKGATLQDRDGALPAAPGIPRSRLGKTNHTAAIWVAHASFCWLRPRHTDDADL